MLHIYRTLQNLLLGYRGPQSENDDSTTLDKLRDSRNYFSGKTDKEIWQLFNKGHEGAFRYIYENYIDLLYRYAQRFTTDIELIKDCIHDLFVELRSSKSLSDTDSIKFYLLKALRSKLKRSVNLFARNQQIPGEQFFLTGFSERSFEALLIERQFNEEQIGKLHQALNKLSARQREALYYYYQENNFAKKY